MKILYFSDNYTYNIYGTKRSLFEGMQDAKHDMIWIDIHSLKDILALINKYNPDQIWLAHSGLILPTQIKNKISIPVVGFGFSDPYRFTPQRFLSYDLYVTNHFPTYLKYKNKFPLIYNPVACDFKFHKNSNSNKNLDITILGRGMHPKFKNKNLRINIVNKLRENKLIIKTFGISWDNHQDSYPAIDGLKVLEIINRSIIGIDILEDQESPLSHRMFEYSACGVPVITLERPEVHKMFRIGKEILTYNSENDLIDKLKYYSIHLDLLKKIGRQASLRCKKTHDIKYRIQNILTVLTAIEAYAKA